MSRQSNNVVTLPLRTMLLASIRSLTPRADEAPEAHGEIAEFPASRVRPPARALRVRSVDWAREIVAEDRRLSYAVVDTRRRLHRLVRETLPRPSFAPAGAGYEHVTLMMARQILTFRARNLGTEECKLAESVASYDEARDQWERSRRQLAVTSGLDTLVAQWTSVRQNAREAYAILRQAGVNPLHP